MKKIKLSIYSGLFILWISFQLNAQVKTDFNNTERITLSGKFNKRYQQLKSSIIPARDIQSLLRRDSLDDLTPEPKPYRIAEPISADIDVVKNAAWIQDESYAYGKYTIYAQGAKSISVNFDQFKLPKGTELYIYNKEGEMISGPVSELETNEENTWGTWVYKGDELTLDFRVPLQATDSLSLHIDNVAYGYKDIYRTEVGGFGDSSPCNVNVLCPLGNGWGEETNSVALILNSNGSAMCSGALINNTCNLNIPYFLTANHCFTSNSNVGGWRFTFQAWSPTCSPTQNANGITFFGSTLRARNAGSDFCLVELNQAIGSSSGLTYAGWSRNTNGIQQTTIIHHPAGDVMKISRDNQPPVFDNFQNAQVWRLVLDQGATNGGSSGGLTLIRIIELLPNITGL
ncbi:MAG TPA: hypothetical protein VFW11_14610 [Cyclobacteriaceae bacterium]|nr:hypothetical protein [Cyclobacteriaceae bacterium]